MLKLSGTTPTEALMTQNPTVAPSASLPYWERPKLGELLIRKGYIDKDQLASALEEARASKELVGVVLLRKQLVFEGELARTLSDQLSVPYINIRQVGVDRFVTRLLPADVGIAAIAIPVRVLPDNVVQVAFGDPTDPQALNAVAEHLPRTSIAVSEVSAITDAWRKIAGIAPTPA
jgi:type IV pilus assembly protein PilB